MLEGKKAAVDFSQKPGCWLLIQLSPVTLCVLQKTPGEKSPMLAEVSGELTALFPVPSDPHISTICKGDRACLFACVTLSCVSENRENQRGSSKLHAQIYAAATALFLIPCRVSTWMYVDAATGTPVRLQARVRRAAHLRCQMLLIPVAQRTSALAKYCRYLVS